MTVPDWGNTEYGAAPDASLTDGEIALASGTDDTAMASSVCPRMPTTSSPSTPRL